MELDDILEMLL